MLESLRFLSLGSPPSLSSRVLKNIEDDSRRSPSSRRRGRREMSLSQASRQVSKFERLIERIKEVESELDELADMAEKMRNMLKTLLEVRE
ncbi:hypothetical protein J7L00_02175 [Candidatus Bathyarchaeota archaeon]|nr:hypothetical protein [Candidatus Bathyarchaeota archaeon]